MAYSIDFDKENNKKCSDGEAADSYYLATATEPAPPLAPLDGEFSADVCVVGGGYAGLSTALHLARQGVAVALLEQARVGSGASGRNGGQVHTGLRHDPKWFEARFGRPAARQYWALALEARAYLDTLIARYQIDAQYCPGLLHAVHRPRYLAEARAHVDEHLRHYPGTRLRFVEAEELRTLVATQDYCGGYLDLSSGHLHALNLALGLSRAARGHGARVFEHTRAMRLEPTPTGWRVHTDRGVISAAKVVLAGNGYLRNLQPAVQARVMPLQNFIVTTEPLGRAGAEKLIRNRMAVSDSRFVVYYFRITPDDRLLFGGGETYTQHQPHDIRALVRPHLLRVFPQLSDARLDYAWGGTLAVTPTRLPYIREIEPGLFNGSGFSGMGVVMAPFAGKVLADAILGSSDAFAMLAALPVPKFPGGRALRHAALIAALSWFALLDRF
ncbi:MAG TPA: FAD-binding oxidoreductase [Steroidobacteraceae bacterium]